MTSLKTTKGLVQSILENDIRARNSDSFLYLRVLEFIGECKGVNLKSVPVSVFLQNMDEYGVPSFETVRRSRQKVQAEYPELAASEKVAEYRAENEEIYREFARS